MGDTGESRARAWLEAAEDCQRASLLSGRHEHWRSACSRAYYASHNASHAIIAHLEPGAIPDRGNLRHGALPGQLRRTLKSSGLNLPDFHVNLLHEGTVIAYRNRVQSDYEPHQGVAQRHFGDSRSAAARVLHLARELING